MSKDPECPICGEHPTIDELIDYEQFCGVTHTSPADELGEEWQITPDELASKMNTRQRFLILDVRDPHEWDICHLPGAMLIPESQLESRINELYPEEEIIIYCRTGVRSARALKLLRRNGFKKLKNLVGGIHGWSDYVDPSFPKY